jgi:hypothetical protein
MQSLGELEALIAVPLSFLTEAFFPAPEGQCRDAIPAAISNI